MKRKVLIVFGTRPEAIKLSPVIRELKETTNLNVLVCVFRQHKEILNQVLETFDIKPDFDLPISISDKALLSKGTGFLLRAKTLLKSGLGFLRFLLLLKREKPDLLIVQGDTSTVFLAGFLAYLFKISIAHVEAGLRTYDKYSPFPEEMNRQLLGRLADIHFAPTESAKRNLLSENVPPEKIHVVGNTEIDALLWILNRHKSPRARKKIEEELEKNYGLRFDNKKKILLVTAHRRESFGKGLENICEALKEIATKRDDVMIVYAVHPNPNVQKTVRAVLSDTKNIFLTPPIAYMPFSFLMGKAHFILTDSGGIQESAPFLNKPVLVMREKTERNEGVKIGTSKLVGTSKKKIVATAFKLLDNQKAYTAMTGKGNPYGDGTASKKIAKILNNYLK